MFFKIGSEIFSIFTEKHSYVGVFFNKIKKRLQHKCFPVNSVKFLRIAFFIEHLRGCFCCVHEMH